MAYCFIMDFAGATTAQYDAVIERMELGGRLPAGALFHGAGLTAGGLRVVDVWERPEDYEAFAQSQIGPHAAAEGIEAPRVQSLPVEQVRRNGLERVTFAQLVVLPRVDAATFAGYDARILGDDHQAPPDCVFHVNGPAEDGWYVMDAWTSKDARDRFLREHVVPAIGDLVEPRIEELPLHATLQVAAEPAAV
jgi:hypothetical protein